MLGSESDNSRGPVRLVFNKVSPAFSAIFLTRFYEKYLAKGFGHSTLLGIFPFENYVAETVGHYALPSKLYPFSLLARKMELLAYDLSASTKHGALKPVPFMGFRLVRRARFRAVGRRARLGDLHRLFSALLVVVMASLLGDLTRDVVGFESESADGDVMGQFFGNLGVGLEDVFLVAFACAVLGLITASVVGRWIRSATDAFTFWMRSNRRVRSIVPLGAVLCIAGTSMYLWGGMVRIVVETIGTDVFDMAMDILGIGAAALGIPAWAFGLVVVSLMFPALAGTVRGLTALREEFVRCVQTWRDVDKLWETVGRVVVLVGSVAAGFFGWLP